MKLITRIILIVLVLTGCATTNTSNETLAGSKSDLSQTQKENWGFMTGKWYGSQPTDDGGIKQEIMVRSPQGTYQVTFRTYDKKGKYKEQTEVGHWGISGPIYFTSFRGWLNGKRFLPSDQADPYNYDAYRIIKLTNESFKYESFSSKEIFTLKKVSDNYVFPEK